MNEFFIKELGADVVDEVMWDGNGTVMAYRKNYMSKYEDAIRETYKKLLSEVYQFSDEQVQNVLDSIRPVDYLNFVRNAYKYRQEGRVTIKTEDDREATKKAIKDAVGYDYRKWIDSLFKGIEEKSGIRNNVDYFTNSGNRRSWEALHWENNLENVVKIMKGQADVGSAAIFTGHGIWGVSAKNYGSIEEIKADSDRLKQLPEEEYNKIKESFGERLHEIAHSIMSKSERNPFIAEDNAMECIIDAVRNSKTKSGILKTLKEYQQLTVTETTVDDIISLVNDISNMPTEYFEAKPQRAVELNEIATAIIPDSTRETTKARLDDMGIKYLEYEAGNEEARLEALNSLEDMRFSLANDGSYAPTFYSQMGKTIDEMKQEKIGANSVVSYLKGRGVKDEEIKWSGIEEFLNGKKSVTKTELQEFVSGSQLQIEEITLDNNEIPYTQEQTAQINEYESERNDVFEELKREWKKAIGTDFPMQTFGLGLESSVVNLLIETDRQLKESEDSGKEMADAREQLKSIFEKEDFGYDSNREAYVYAVKNPYDFIYNYDITDEQKAIFERFISAKENYKNAEGIPVETQRHIKDIAAKSDNISRKISRIKSEHYAENAKYMTKWSEYTLDGGYNYREIIFTMPDSTYTNASMNMHWSGSIANGKGVLAHARIQDFNVDGEKMLFIEEIQSDWHNEGAKKGYVTRNDADIRAKRQELENYIKSRLGKENSAEEIAKLQEARREYLRLGQNMSNDEAVPDAPYRNNYHEFVLKNLIRMAAEQGYDSIGWTTADIQSKRWSDEYAEGYRIEYDQEIPKFLNKYGKKWGTKVGKTEIGREEGHWEEKARWVEKEGATVWTMPITDSMKDSVLYEGQARYSLATDGILDLEDLWTEAIEEYGTIPKGEIPARDVDVPKKINKKDVVSRFARTMIEAGVTPDETVSEFEKAILDGTMTHEVITNKNASERAKQLIKHLGFEGALEQWSVLSDSGKVGKNELALGMELYNQCITNKDVHNAMKIAAELVAEATHAGQTLQATRMLKRMTPDGQLYYLEKSIQKMNEEFKEKLGDKYKDIELDEALMEEFLTEKDEKKRNEIYDKVCQNIADQIPATKLDKWNSWRYLAMLGNPRTHLRNIFGNAVFIPSLKLKNYIGAVMEKAAKVNTSDRTKSLRKSKEAVEFANKDVEEMMKILQGENAKYAVTGDIQGKRTIFKTKWLEKLRLKNFDFLEREDMWFLKYHYTDALARLITARNIDVNSITPQILEQLRAYAVKEAQAATYRDANALAEGLNRLQKNLEHSNKRSIRASGVLLEGVMPFKKTPLNIAKQGINYSPIGILKGVYNALTKLKAGDTTITDVIDDLSKGLSGTMVMMLGYFLASMGWLGGDEDKTKKEKEFDKMVGEQSYALNIGDVFSYTIDWMTPSNLSLFIGAKLHDLTKDDFEFADVVGALSTVTEPLLELSVFSGLNGVIESAQYSDSEALLAIGSDMITSYLMQGLPTIGGQISRIVDQSKREYYYTDKNSVLPQGLQRLIGQASSKIPFASYLFQPAIDEWGREETYGDVTERVLENTVSPGYYSANNYTEVDKELKELHERTGDDSVLPTIQQKKYTEDSVNYYMSAEDYTETKKIRGQKSFELVSELLSDKKSVKLQNKKTKKYQNKRYSQMSDDEKVRAIKKCYEDAGDYTKEQMLEKVKSKSK